MAKQVFVRNYWYESIRHLYGHSHDGNSDSGQSLHMCQAAHPASTDKKHRHAKRARVIFLVIGVFVELFTVMICLSFFGGYDVQREGNWKSIICKYNVTSVMVR